MSHYPPIAERPGQRCMLDTLGRDFYQTYIATNSNYVVQNFTGSAQNIPKYCHRRSVKLFPVREPLEFSAMCIVKLFPETMQDSRNRVVITNRSFKLWMTISTLRTTATHTAGLFMDHWLLPYAIPMYLLIDSEIQFLSDFVTKKCTPLGFKYLTDTTYHPQSSSEATRFNKTIPSSFRYQIAERQRD